MPCLAASLERLRESLSLDLPPQLQDTQALPQVLLHQHPLPLLRQVQTLQYTLQHSSRARGIMHDMRVKISGYCCCCFEWETQTAALQLHICCEHWSIEVSQPPC